MKNLSHAMRKAMPGAVSVDKGAGLRGDLVHPSTAGHPLRPRRKSSNHPVPDLFMSMEILIFANGKSVVHDVN